MHDDSKTKEELISELAELRLTQFTVDRAADAIFWMGPDAKFVYANDQACRSLGYSREELLSMTVHDIDPNFPAERWLRHWKDLKQRGSFTFESSHRRKDGREFPVEITVNYLHFNGFEYNCAFARDITEREAMLEDLSREKYFSEMIIESLPNIFYLMDDNGSFHLWNKNAEIITGYSAEEIKRMNVMEFFEGEDKILIAEKMKEVFDKGESNTEADLVIKSGRKISHYITGKRLIIENKQYIAGVCVDISKLKEAEKVIRESEEKYRSFVENFQGIAYKGNMDFSAIFFHGQVENMTGYTETDFINGKPRWNQVIHPDDLPRLKESFENVRLVPEYSDVREYRIIHKNGQTRWVRERINNICDSSGRPAQVQGTIQDITVEKSAEIDLLESEKKYHRLIDALQEGIWMIDNDDRTIFVNERMADMLGYASVEMLGKSVFSFMDDHWKEVCRYYVERRRNGIREQHDFEFIKKDGSRLNVTMAASPVYDEDGNYMGGISGVIDITERKKAEHALEQEKLMLENITSFVNCGLLLLDEQTRIIYANRVFEDWFGSLYQIRGKKCYEVLRLEDPENECAGLRTLRTGSVARSDNFVTSSDGVVKCFYVITFPLKDSAGIIQRISAVVIDITERKHAEEEVEKFKFISDNANDAHFLVDRDAKFRYVNQTACRMLGYSEKELLTLGVPDVDIVYDIEKYGELFDRIQRETVPPFQTVNRKKDGSSFDSELSVTGYQLEGKPYMFAVLRDISERKEAEEKIITALKDKEVLMKEIHHRVKNNLSIVSSLLRLQAAQVKEEHLKALFNESITRIKAMALIHEKLYRSEEISKIMFSEYIRDTVNNVFTSYGTTPRITLKTDIERITLGIDASVPCGLIVNELITNSMKYAFPVGREGEITVSLRSNDEGEIELKVGDNGVGMPEGLDFRNPDSLGLTLVNALVRQLHGNIELFREKGVEFLITFKS